jgi:diguanylate cyclase (GGDEF)-like protein
MGGESSASLIPYRLRTVRIGVLTTAAAVVVLLAYPFLPGRGDVRIVPYYCLAGFAGVAVMGIGRLPWEYLLSRTLGTWLFYLWSAFDIALVSAAIVVTGGIRSDLFLIYTLTTVFFAASYPRKGQVALGIFTALAYLLSVGPSAWGAHVGTLFERIGLLGCTCLIASFLSHELLEQTRLAMDARQESDQRASLLAMVAGAARAMSTLDPDRVLNIVVESVLELGFESSEICMFDELGDTWQQGYFGGNAVGVKEIQPGDAGLAGAVYAQGRTMVIEDYGSWTWGLLPVRKSGIKTVIGSPVWSGSDLVGVLIAGGVDRRVIHPHERECFELLAAQAGAALVNARRYTEREAFEERLSHQAFHDALTGLPNRVLFADRLDHALAARERENAEVAVLFLDLDRFKMVNDSLGHDVGDGLLQEVAGRLRVCLRPGDTLARYGGDEFTMLLERSGEGPAVQVAERILEALRQPFNLAGRSFFVNASVGIAVTRPGVDPGDPLRAADLAMYRAKDRGRDRWELFQQEMNDEALQRLERETQLRQAIERREFVLAYQPIIDLVSGETMAVEALVRWRHPTRGEVSPAEFVPLAEETGLIVPLGQWVLEEACRQAREWRRQGLPTVRMHVNLSAGQLQQKGLVAHVAEVVGRIGIVPSQLVLEVTETMVMGDVEAAIDVMRSLHHLGIGVSLDDFGTGNSSLSHLKRFPLRSVKIDKSFITGLGSSGPDQAVVRSVVMMARELGMLVVAEGIETADELAAAARLGCDQGQGFHFARALPPASFAARLREEHSAGAAGADVASAAAVS